MNRKEGGLPLSKKDCSYQSLNPPANPSINQGGTPRTRASPSTQLWITIKRFVHQGRLFQIQNPELINIRISGSGRWESCVQTNSQVRTAGKTRSGPHSGRDLWGRVDGEQNCLHNKAIKQGAGGTGSGVMLVQPSTPQTWYRRHGSHVSLWASPKPSMTVLQ